jgi:hypothetical protein
MATGVGLTDQQRGLATRVVPFTAGDGLDCNLVNVRGEREPTREPVMLVHGAGVRSRIFQAPVQSSIVDALVDAGHDVWLENWRASIDLPPNEWDLDQAAIHDHPAAVRTIVRETGSPTLKALIHCQGSTSFLMSAAAGMVPEVTTIASHPEMSLVQSQYCPDAGIPLRAGLCRVAGSGRVEPEPWVGRVEGEG